ncbi:MAG: alpha/beta fold hydrolase [Spirochaetia bacterium]
MPGYRVLMELSYRTLGGEGAPIVILHGLFGSSQNWAGMGRKLASQGTACALDLRNHGDSPHAPTHTLPDCVGDLHEWVSARAREPVRLIGHSMGGQVAMGFAVALPDLVAGIAVLDIAPRPYPPDNERELRALRTDIRGCRTRAEVDALLAPVLPDPGVRQFIMTNAVREGEGFRWRLNVEALAASTLSSDFADFAGRYEGPSLLVACGRSTYVKEEDRVLMTRYFPAVTIRTIPEADHWPHISAPAALEKTLHEFLSWTSGNSVRGLQ